MKIVKELITREIAGDVILVPVGRSVIDHNGLFVLNPVSAEIWQLLNEGKSQEQIVAALAKDFDAPEAVIAADVEEFFQSLEKHGILER